MEVALAHQHAAGGERRHHGADDFRPRLLERFVHHAALDFGHARLLGRDLEAVARQIDVVRRVALPDGEDDVDGFGEYFIAVFLQQAEGLGVRRKSAGADATNEAAFREVVEHRGVGCDERRVRVRQIGGAGRKLDGLRRVDQRRQKNKTVGDVLGFLGQVLADECVVKPEPVRENDRFAVFLQRFRGCAMRRMHGHREVTKSHEVQSFFPAGPRLEP